jgi:6-phosphogluconolactonase (cycloisomerase 2 family)
MDGMAMEGMGSGAVYVQTNADPNEVIAFARSEDGTLARIGAFATGGRGDGVAHLTSQGSVVRSSDGRSLLVTNVASDDVSVFRILDEGLELVGRTPTGSAPKSVAEREGLVYVLNTGKPSVRGFRLGDAGLEELAGAEQALSASNADPAQVGFTPDGRSIVVTERGTDSIATFDVSATGMLGEMRVTASSGPTPYGFAISEDGVLVVTEAFRAERGAAAASSYTISGGVVTPVTASVGNGRSEICWAVVAGRRVYTTNFADGAISRYAIGMGGELVLEDATAGVTEDGRSGLRDEDLTPDGRFLYAIDADQGRIAGWRVGAMGELSPIGSWDGVPTTVAGLAAS